MAISFAKNCKDRCPVFSPRFGVIPGHIWGKNGTRPVITPTYSKFSEANTGHWTLDIGQSARNVCSISATL